MRPNGRGSRFYRPRSWASFAARLGLILAALALFSQSLVLAAPMSVGRLAEARAAQSQLAASFGPGVVVCIETDDPASPPPPGCRDACPLCRLAADMSALDVPAPPSFTAPLRYALAARATAVPASPPVTQANQRPLPRGPPSKA